jgi:uncharacterized protein YycO
MSRRFNLALSVFGLLGTLGCSSCSEKSLQDGDVVFQDFPTPQSEAIKLATQSEYSHCGIVFFKDGEPIVWEAVQPVQMTPLDEWIARDSSGHYVVRRLKGADSLLTESGLERMKTAGQQHMGKDYDIYFAWSDEQLYCSELVWKMYSAGVGVELAPLRTLGDYEISHPVVREIMQRRWGDDFPSEEPVVAPGDLYRSDLMETVYSQ